MKSRVGENRLQTWEEATHAVHVCSLPSPARCPSIKAEQLVRIRNCLQECLEDKSVVCSQYYY